MAKLTRVQKIQILLSTVRSEGDGVYSVESLSLPGWRYLLYPRTLSTPASCQCEDYQRHRHVRAYRCIHLQAVREYVRATQPRVVTLKESLSQLGDRLRAQRDQQAAMSRALTAAEGGGYAI